MIPKLGKDSKILYPSLTMCVPCSILQGFSMEYRVIECLLHTLTKLFILLLNGPKNAHVYRPSVSDLGCRPLEIMPSTGGSLEVKNWRSRSMLQKNLVPKAGCSGIPS